jgi:mono/diheme cytochrome c family protein
VPDPHPALAGAPRPAAAAARPRAGAAPRAALAARVLAALLALALALVGGVYAASEWRMRARVAVPAHAFAAPGGAAAVARGRRLALTHGCADCHGEDLGGRVVLDEPAIGRVAGTNLTRGGRAAALTDADWERAVRHGVRRDGRPLLFMPAHEYAGVADDEVAAVVAYARAAPAVRRELPATYAGPLGRLLFLAGRVAFVPAERVDHARPHPASVPPAPTAAYGAYLAAGCVGCHGATYAGGRIAGAPPDWPPAANLTPAALGAWTEADFARALREGRRPDGRAIRPPMPIAATRHLNDVEVAALWAYLRTLPARPTGAR